MIRTIVSPRVDAATLATRVAAWRSSRPVVATATTKAVAVASLASRIGRPELNGDRRALLSALPSRPMRRWSR